MLALLCLILVYILCNMCNNVNNLKHQDSNESCCSVTVAAAAAGPVLALGAHILSNGSAERYVAIVKDLYMSNNLPCPDMQLMLQYSALTATGEADMPWKVADDDGHYSEPDIIHEEKPIGSKDIDHMGVPVYEEPYSWVDSKPSGFKSEILSSVLEEQVSWDYNRRTGFKSELASSLAVTDLDDPLFWVDDKRTGFKNEVYSLVTSDMEDWFDEDVSLYCFPDTDAKDLSLDASVPLPIAAPKGISVLHSIAPMVETPPALPPREYKTGAKVKRTSTRLERTDERRTCYTIQEQFNKVVDLSRISRSQPLVSTIATSMSMEFRPESSNELKLSQCSKFYTPAPTNIHSSGLGSIVSNSIHQSRSPCRQLSYGGYFSSSPVDAKDLSLDASVPLPITAPKGISVLHSIAPIVETPPALPPREYKTGAKVKRTSTRLERTDERRPCYTIQEEFNKVVDLSKISKAHPLGSTMATSMSMEFRPESSNELKLSQFSQFYTPAPTNISSSGLGSFVSNSIHQSRSPCRQFSYGGYFSSSGRQCVDIHQSSSQSSYHHKRQSRLDSPFLEGYFTPVDDSISPTLIVQSGKSYTINENLNKIEKKGILKATVGSMNTVHSLISPVHSIRPKKTTKKGILKKLVGHSKTNSVPKSSTNNKSHKKTSTKSVLKSIKKRMGITKRPLETDV